MKPCIYMVDDEPDFQTVVATWLRPGYDHVALASGDELFGALSAGIPDLVLLDIHLPGADGFELCRRIRATPGLERLPVLFLTASREHADYGRNILDGGSGFLTKPIGRRQFLTSIEEVLDKTRAIDRALADTGGGD